MSQSFVYCPICGSRDFASAGPNLLVCGQCDFHHHLNPVVAVAGFLADSSRRILMIRRAKEPAKGKLALPGGFVDIGETGEEALRREIKEEVNLRADEIKYLMSHPNEYLYRGRVVPVLDLFYTATVQSWETLAALHEVQSFLLLDPAAISPDELAFISMRAALKRYLAG